MTTKDKEVLFMIFCEYTKTLALTENFSRIMQIVHAKDMDEKMQEAGDAWHAFVPAFALGLKLGANPHSEMENMVKSPEAVAMVSPEMERHIRSGWCPCHGEKCPDRAKEPTPEQKNSEPKSPSASVDFNLDAFLQSMTDNFTKEHN